MRAKSFEFEDVWIGFLEDLMTTLDAFMSWIISGNAAAAN